MTSSDHASPRVKLENVSVRIPVFASPLHRSLKHVALRAATGGLINAGAGKVPEVLALDDICLDIAAGARLGVLGHNGAGKTTLLRVIGGILTPTSGRACIQGDVSLMLNPAMGMNPEITGREFIDVQCSIMRISREEVESRQAEIVAFSELGEFIDFPVRTYSTGMQTRLTFSVATAFDAEILVLDEALGTGDADFQAKAARRFREWVERARIVVLASHSPQLIGEFCNSTMLLQHGRIVEST